MQTPSFPTFFRNSTLIALGVTPLTLVVSSLGAYGLSKYRTRGRRVLLMAILTSQTFPTVLILVPFYTFALQVHLNDTYLGILLAQTSGALPFCMWTLKSYMDAVPGELVEASLIDGCSKVGTYLRIALPTSLPGRGRLLRLYRVVGRLPLCLRDLRQRSHGHPADLPVSHQQLAAAELEHDRRHHGAGHSARGDRLRLCAALADRRVTGRSGQGLTTPRSVQAEGIDSFLSHGILAPEGHSSSALRMLYSSERGHTGRVSPFSA